MAKLTLNEQAEKILEAAEASGVQSNFFFITTFKRYTVQLSILTELEKKIRENGALVTKSYVKGTENLYANPAVAEYNRTTDSANKTLSTLLKIIRTFKSLEEETDTEDEDPLMKAINGGDGDGE